MLKFSRALISLLFVAAGPQSFSLNGALRLDYAALSAVSARVGLYQRIGRNRGRRRRGCAADAARGGLGFTGATARGVSGQYLHGDRRSRARRLSNSLDTSVGAFAAAIRFDVVGLVGDSAPDFQVLTF